MVMRNDDVLGTKQQGVAVDDLRIDHRMILRPGRDHLESHHIVLDVQNQQHEMLLIIIERREDAPQDLIDILWLSYRLKHEFILGSALWLGDFDEDRPQRPAIDRFGVRKVYDGSSLDSQILLHYGSSYDTLVRPIVQTALDEAGAAWRIRCHGSATANVAYSGLRCKPPCIYIDTPQSPPIGDSTDDSYLCALWLM